MSDRTQRDAAEEQYGCRCADCLEKYHRAQLARDPYYRPRTEWTEADTYARCRRDPYARDLNDDGRAGN